MQRTQSYRDGAFFFLIHRSHSKSFTRAQGIPKYTIGFGREKDGRVGERFSDCAVDHVANVACTICMIDVVDFAGKWAAMFAVCH